MVVRRHRDLEAWQRADIVRKAFLELTARDVVRRDFDFCDQTRRAARSACRNIAEGFYRFRHPEFANFMNIAIGSLGELLDSTDDALENRYLDKAAHQELNTLIDRAMASSMALQQHLLTTPTPPRRRRQ